jgi:hypothetical protein
VLADQEAEAITQPRLTIVRAIGGVRAFLLATNLRRIWRSREPSQLFNRAKADTIGLPQSAVNSSGFGHAHLSPSDQRRHIGRIGVTVTAEPSGGSALIDSRLKNPAVGKGIREAILNISFNSETAASLSYV